MTLTEGSACVGMGFLFTFGPLGVKAISLESINSCTLYLRALQFSIVYLGALEWNSHHILKGEVLGEASDPLNTLMSLGENEGEVDCKAYEMGQTFSLAFVVSVGLVESSFDVVIRTVAGIALVIVE